MSSTTTQDAHASTLRSMNQRLDAYTNRLQAVFSSAGMQEDASTFAKSTRSISSRYSKPSPASLRGGAQLSPQAEPGRPKYSLCEQVLIEDGKKRARLLCDSRLQSVQKKIVEVQTANLSHTSRHQSPSVASGRNRMQIPTPDQQLERLRRFGAASERGALVHRPVHEPSQGRDPVREDRSRSRPRPAHPSQRDPGRTAPDEYLLSRPQAPRESTPRDAVAVRAALHQRHASQLRDAPDSPHTGFGSFRDRDSQRGPEPQPGSWRDQPRTQCTLE